MIIEESHAKHELLWIGVHDEKIFAALEAWWKRHVATVSATYSYSREITRSKHIKEIKNEGKHKMYTSIVELIEKNNAFKIESELQGHPSWTETDKITLMVLK